MRPLALRKISPDVLAIFCQISKRRKPIYFSCLGQDWQVKILNDVDHKINLMSIEANWGGSQLLFRIDPNWITKIAENILGIERIFDFQDQIRDLFLDSALAEASDLIEKSTRKRFSLLGLSELKHIENSEKLFFEINDGENSFLGEIYLDHLGLGFLVNAFREIPIEYQSNELWDELPILVSFPIGWTDLKKSTIESLKKRDVIILDESWLGNINDHEIFLQIGKKLSAVATLNANQITVTGEILQMMDDLEQSDIDAESVYDELTIRLNFDLGERFVNLAELRTILPGYVFELGRDLRKSVSIRANGKIIGMGELVDIDGQTGVSIISLIPPSK